MSSNTWRAIGVSAAIGAAAFSALGGSGELCYKPLWAGLTQSTGVGSARCEKYTNCPTAIKCYPGALYLISGDPINQTVYCTTYKNGTWDERKGRCVGGEAEVSEETVTISVQQCTNGCN